MKAIKSVTIDLDFVGVQEFGDEKFSLYTLKQPLFNPEQGYEHPAGSTLTDKTLEKLGFTIL
jgi:hypothetical protein